MKVLHVIGARPNFMKAAPVLAALAARGVEQVLVHTGQHYDAAMSDIFFQHLGLPKPDVNLNVGSGTHSVQTAEVMMRFEPVVLEHKPDWVLVYGDVNSTVAAALVCAKLLVRVAHVEAGLRSNDRTMPEEINRIVTDSIADLLFTPSADGDENLRREGVPESRIRRIGNVMIDTLVRLLPVARERWPELATRLGIERFGLLTLHRPSNVDDPAKLQRLVAALSELSCELPLVFPIHPRTREALRGLDLEVPPTLVLTDPLGYLDFLALQERATVVITDSGGVQEETTYLGVPCLTLRANTERPVTVDVGTNVLIGDDLDRLRAEVRAILGGTVRRGSIPELWEGHAAERIADVLLAG
ncbi:MAG TPA: UDP-N-acetylglucosamine 2-epimerase (non-hydrolyzing) [Thermoanaerobaculia bacterium]|jgi:UDP-N-acetylglucosamine 2-epimerase (non-hydrolysing)